MIVVASRAGHSTLGVRRVVLAARATCGSCSSRARATSCAVRCSRCSSACTGWRASPPGWRRSTSSCARAGRALDDLAAAPRGGHGPHGVELVDLADAGRSYAPAWRALAAGTAHDACARPRTCARRPAATCAGAAVGRRERAVAPRSPTTVLADPLRLAQACANLVANAAEHGGGVCACACARRGGRVRIEVADAGPGLPAPLSVMTATARGRRGRRGHGLAIAAAIAEHHGGRLAADGARLTIGAAARG